MPSLEEYLNMDFGLDDGTDPEDSSLVRPSDTDLYAHGAASPYQDKAMLLSSAQAKAEDNAMSYLMQALNKQADISPEQGIATALLAAIPTFGGYMIGKSVGSPDLPAGYFEAGGTRSAIGLDKMGDPGAEGGLAGAAAGGAAAQGYLKGLDADQAQKNEVYQKMAALESNKASRLETQANAYEKAGMDVQTDLAMLPIKEASQMRVQDNAARNTMDRQLEMDRIRSDREKLPAALLTKEVLTDADVAGLTPEALKSLTAFRAENRRLQNQNFNQNEAKGQEYIPGTQILPGANPNPKAIFEAQKAVKNYNEIARVHLPELKRVFTNPNTSTDEQAAALAGVVVAIKNQQGMGANFTGLEEALVKAGLPRIAEISPSAMAQFLKANLQGQDALGKIARLEQVINLSVESQLNPYGYTLDRRFEVPSGNSVNIDKNSAEFQALKAKKLAELKAQRGIK